MVADFWIWLADQLDVAKDIGVLEHAFWNMTPRELTWRNEIFRRRQIREYERLAWLAHHLMSAWVGDKAPSVDDLLGRRVDA